jgi:hypothetical protein
MLSQKFTDGEKILIRKISAFVKMLLEYTEFRADYTQSFDKNKAGKLQDNMWTFVMAKEKDEKYSWVS